MDFVWDIFRTTGFVPRWTCGPVWHDEPGWGWLLIASDFAIWGAYTAIPLVILRFLSARPEIPFARVYWLFGAFIFACGLTHLMDSVLFWWPAYRLSAVIKFATAVISWTTVFALLPNLRKAITLRSPAELEDEIQRRTHQLEQLTLQLQEEAQSRSRIAETLEASEGRLRLALQAGQMGTWDWNLRTNLAVFDDVEVKLTQLGGDSRPVSTDEFFLRVHPDDREAVRIACDQSIQHRTPYNQEFRYLQPNGEVRWLAGRGLVVGDSHGEPVQFVGINFDITARKQTEEMLRLRTRAIEFATNGIILVDVRAHDQPIVYANPAFAELTGYPVSDLVGQNCRILQGPKTDHDTAILLREAVRQSRECAVTLLNYRKSGEPFWNDIRISPVESPEGLVTHYVGVSTNATRRVEGEHELRQARRQAESANAAKTQFLANMSHEIRTPLTAILGCADTLYRQVLEEEPRELIKMVRDQGQLLLGILNDVLDVSKIEAGKLEVRPESCSIVPIIAEVRSLMEPQATERGIRLETEFPTQVPETIRTDPLRLRQILLNLASNAVKFTDEGRVTIRVRCETESDPAELAIQVEDTGTGIPREKFEAIFEPFTQMGEQATHRASGTGLGLTICRSLVGMLGGRLTLTSRVGKGSTFTVRLPLGDPRDLRLRDAGMLLERASESPDTESLHVLVPARVLVAEDTRGIQFMLRQMLREFVGSVTIVGNGEEAIAEIHRAEAANEPYDLILMDMQMPVLNGYEATARLRAEGYTRPIIALTAGAMAGDREQCLKAGCNDYLTKPIDRTRLLTILVNHSGEDA